LNKFDIIDFLVISFDFVLKIHAIKRRIWLKQIQFIFQMFSLPTSSIKNIFTYQF
jgi:hypothetical protein